MKKILFHNPTNDGGGHYIKLHELMEKFEKEGYEVYFVSPPGYDESDSVVHLPDGKYGISDLDIPTHWISIFIYLLYIRPDYFVSFNFIGGFFGGVASLLSRRTKCITRISADLLTENLGTTHTIKYESLRVLESICFLLCDIVIFISKHNRNMMIDRSLVGHDKVNSILLYNNLYPPRVKKQLHKSVELTGQPIVGYVGNFPQGNGKGVEDLIKAFTRLTNEYKGATLYLVGDGQDKAKLEQLCRILNIRSQVKFTGWVDSPIPYMKDFDVLVLPSKNEALGGVLLEAMAAGTPVIGSRVGGIPEVVGDQRFLFEPGNIGALEKRAKYVISNQKSAWEHFEDHRKKFDFDWSQQAYQIVTSDEKFSTSHS